MSSRAERSDARYPASRLAGQLQLVGRLIKAGFGARVYYVEHGDGGQSYDTHSGQLPHHAHMLDELSGALGAFQSDLEASGLADRAARLVFSEFGRRVAENATHGTDHGTAAPVFLIGGAIRGGLVGTTPSLTDLEDGDLKTHLTSVACMPPCWSIGSGCHRERRSAEPSSRCRSSEANKSPLNRLLQQFFNLLGDRKAHRITPRLVETDQALGIDDIHLRERFLTPEVSETVTLSIADDRPGNAVFSHDGTNRITAAAIRRHDAET